MRKRTNNSLKRNTRNPRFHTRQILHVCTLFLVIFSSCSKDQDTDRITLSTDKVFNLSNEEQVLRVGVNSVSDWNFSESERWCSAKRTNDTLVISVSANITPHERFAILQLKNQEDQLTLTINQEESSGEEYHFRLPVIFHVLYQNASDSRQNIPAERIWEVLERTNEYYHNANGKGEDMNLTFELATHDAQGNPLAEAGINRVKRYSSTTIDHEKFLNNEYGDNKLLWDLNKYINIVLFTFEQTQVVGVSLLPYTPKSHALEGLSSADAYYTQLPNNQARCVAINNAYAYLRMNTPEGSQDIFATTLAHELGHYLGVFHPFSEGETPETDYCADTQDYNREAYVEYINNHPDLFWEQRIMRTARDGKTFTSTNLMDYDFGLMNRFTRDQRTRIRHVLEYSPLIPGPKIPVAITRGEDSEASYTIIE